MGGPHVAEIWQLRETLAAEAAAALGTEGG
jgi:hypothetical protein